MFVKNSSYINFRYIKEILSILLEIFDPILVLHFKDKERKIRKGRIVALYMFILLFMWEGYVKLMQNV